MLIHVKTVCDISTKLFLLKVQKKRNIFQRLKREDGDSNNNNNLVVDNLDDIEVSAESVLVSISSTFYKKLLGF